MLIAKHLDAALRILREVAKDQNKKCSAAELSQNLGLPEPLVRRVLRNLAKAGILSSYLERRGGYTLAKPLAKVSLEHVLQALDREGLVLGTMG